MHGMGNGIVQLGVGGEFAQALISRPIGDGRDEARRHALATDRRIHHNALQEGHRRSLGAIDVVRPHTGLGEPDCVAVGNHTKEGDKLLRLRQRIDDFSPMSFERQMRPELMAKGCPGVEILFCRSPDPKAGHDNRAQMPSSGPRRISPSTTDPVSPGMANTSRTP